MSNSNIRYWKDRTTDTKQIAWLSILLLGYDAQKQSNTIPNMYQSWPRVQDGQTVKLFC